MNVKTYFSTLNNELLNSLKYSANIFLCSVIFVMSGCAVQPPEPIRESIPNNPAISQVQQNISKYKGSRVRWGGEIYATQNRKSETELEIIARPLDNIAKPNADASNGRFMVIFKGFLEPSLFTQGRDITVIGKVTDLVTGNIGEYEYQYPVIVAESYYLWPQVHYIYAPYPRRYDPFYYDPWYPWYPWWYY